MTATFLIPYFVMLAINGIPLFYMELAIGQYLSLGTVGAWTALCPMARGEPFGYTAVNIFFYKTRNNSDNFFTELFNMLKIQKCSSFQLTAKIKLKDNKLDIKLRPFCLGFVPTGIGFGMIMVSFLVSIYYNMIIAWCLLYMFQSFRKDVPWRTCDNTWNTPLCQ